MRIQTKIKIYVYTYTIYDFAVVSENCNKIVFAAQVIRNWQL